MIGAGPGGGHKHDPKSWYYILEEIVKDCRPTNEGMRFGQLIFNAICMHDKVNYTSEYDANFHSRLFQIYDEELVQALQEWQEFINKSL